MRTSDWTRRIGRTPLAPVAALPLRLRTVARHDARVVAQSARWLVGSREHHNYTYDLTPRNLEHLAWFVATVTARPIAEVRRWVAEIDGDTQLRHHVLDRVRSSPRRWLADETVRYGRRIGWYALIRARKPRHVVESGIDKGLGSCVIAAALLRNAAEGCAGRLTGLDINPDAGYLIAGRYAQVADVVIGDSLQSIPRLTEKVDLFLHDSNHSERHERAEFDLVEEQLSTEALLITDNASQSDVLARRAESTGRRFLFFREEPADHWYPGDGIGAAWRD